MVLACFALVGRWLQFKFLPGTLLRPCFSYSLHPSNRVEKEENWVSPDDPCLRHLTAYFSALFRLGSYFKGDLLYHLEGWVGTH